MLVWNQQRQRSLTCDTGRYPGHGALRYCTVWGVVQPGGYLYESLKYTNSTMYLYNNILRFLLQQYKVSEYQCSKVNHKLEWPTQNKILYFDVVKLINSNNPLWHQYTFVAQFTLCRVETPVLLRSYIVRPHAFNAIF